MSVRWAVTRERPRVASRSRIITPLVVGISYLDQYTLQGGTTSLTMVPPAGSAAGDLDIIWVANKNSSVTPTNPSGGWTLLGQQAVGTGADGVGTGQVMLTAWYRVLAAASTNTSITITGANRALGGGMVYRKSDAGLTWAPTISFGSDTSNDTSFSATVAANLGVMVGDYLLSVGVFTLNTSLPGRDIAIPGMTFTSAGVNSAGGAVGNQIFLWTDQTKPTSGTQSSASSTIATSGAATTGGAFNLRVTASSGTTVAVPQASETDTATALTEQKLKALSQAAETDTASALTETKRASMPQATGAETAGALTAVAGHVVDQAAEADTATALVERKLKTVTQASSTETAAVITARKTKAIGQAAEADSSMALTEAKQKIAGQVTETATATVLGERKTRLVSQATEADTARDIVRPGQVVRAIETDTAQPLGEAKSKSLAQSASTDTAGVITKRKTYQVIQAVESSTATALVELKRMTFAQALETETAYLLVDRKAKTVAQAAETETAQAIGGGGQLLVLDRATETDTARSIVPDLTTPRPNTGTTGRPGSGTTARPFTGVTARP